MKEKNFNQWDLEIKEGIKRVYRDKVYDEDTIKNLYEYFLKENNLDKMHGLHERYLSWIEVKTSKDEERIKYLHEKFMKGEKFSKEEQIECTYFITMLEPIRRTSTSYWDYPKVVTWASRSIILVSACFSSMCILKLMQG